MQHNIISFIWFLNLNYSILKQTRYGSGNIVSIHLKNTHNCCLAYSYHENNQHPRLVQTLFKYPWRFPPAFIHFRSPNLSNFQKQLSNFFIRSLMWVSAIETILSTRITGFNASWPLSLVEAILQNWNNSKLQTSKTSSQHLFTNIYNSIPCC